MSRFNVDFSDEALAILTYLSVKMGGVSKAEVIRRALNLEKWFYDAQDAGEKIILEKPDGSLREVVRL